MLPSQTARPASSRSHMYRRTRRKRLPIVIGVLVIALGVAVVFKFFLRGGSPSPAAAAPSAAITPSPIAHSNNIQSDVKNISSSSSSASNSAPPVANPKTSLPIAPPKTNDKLTMGGGSNTSSAASTGDSSHQQLPTIPNLMNFASGNKPDKPAPPSKSTAPGVSSPPSNSNAAAPPPTPPVQPPSGEAAARAAGRMKSGFDLLAQNKPIEGRRMLTLAIDTPGLSATDALKVRDELTKLNSKLVFSSETIANDPFSRPYAIESGDSLAKLPKKLGLNVDWRFLQRINNISSPEKIRVGQRIKIITGPFHAIVHKRDFRMDLYMGDGENRVFVRSFKVGLGENDATPEGMFTVKPNSKLINPAWSNPRTGEHFEPNDPKNPLGEYWIGLIGVSENIRDLESYGIHGTVDPDSVGQMKSMGCVRMLADDIALVYELMIDSVSRVEIRAEN